MFGSSGCVIHVSIFWIWDLDSDKQWVSRRGMSQDVLSQSGLESGEKLLAS